MIYGSKTKNNREILRYEVQKDSSDVLQYNNEKPKTKNLLFQSDLDMFSVPHDSSWLLNKLVKTQNTFCEAYVLG